MHVCIHVHVQVHMYRCKPTPMHVLMWSICSTGEQFLPVVEGGHNGRERQQMQKILGSVIAKNDNDVDMNKVGTMGWRMRGADCPVSRMQPFLKFFFGSAGCEFVHGGRREEESRAKREWRGEWGQEGERRKETRGEGRTTGQRETTQETKENEEIGRQSGETKHRDICELVNAN